LNGFTFSAPPVTLVESHPAETDADFRAAMDAALQAITPTRPNWWHPYEVRGTYECRGIRFRHFYCIAGSVELWTLTIARENGSRRVILLPDGSTEIFGPIKMYGHGEEVVIASGEVRTVRLAGDQRPSLTCTKGIASFVRRLLGRSAAR
jgi:hypothetical protein